MKHTLPALLLVIFAGLIPANFVCAANPLDVVISEICWMGTETSPTDEWIELYNNTTSTIDITNWTLKSTDTSPNITFTATIEPKTSGARVSTYFSIPREGFYLLERTDDDSVKGVEANFIYTGALNNSGEKLELRDADGNLIDAVNCGSGWLAGDNATNQTMERKDLSLSARADNWQTSALPGGTPANCHSELREESPGPTVDTEQHAEQRDSSLRSAELVQNDNDGGNIEQLSVINNQLSISYPTNILINEILPSPDGPDTENEWIEIFNQNNFSVDISGWKIADTNGSVKSYTFSRNTIIQTKSFLLLPRPQTKITLNNNKDGLNLIHPDGTITDSVAFTKAKLNQSYNRIGDNWAWSDTLTPGWENIIPVATTDDIKENSASNADNDADVNRVNFTKGKVNSVNSDYTFPTQAKPIHFTASLLALFCSFSILALKRSMISD